MIERAGWAGLAGPPARTHVLLLTLVPCVPCFLAAAPCFASIAATQGTSQQLDSPTLVSLSLLPYRTSLGISLTISAWQAPLSTTLVSVPSQRTSCPGAQPCTTYYGTKLSGARKLPPAYFYHEDLVVSPTPSTPSQPPAHWLEIGLRKLFLHQAGCARASGSSAFGHRSQRGFELLTRSQLRVLGASLSRRH